LEAPLGKLPVNMNGELGPAFWSITDDMFGQCWSLNGNSEAMRRIYSPYKEKILLQTSVKKFELIKNQIKYGMLAPVTYYKNLLRELKHIETLSFPINSYKYGFLKRNAFEHEKEVRIITLIDNKYRSENCNYIEIELDPLKFIDGIIIDPRASNQHVDLIKKYCKRAGFTIIPEKLDLYSDIYEKTGIFFKP